MRPPLVTALLLVLPSAVFAQSISVTNFLHPEAPVARDSFAAIEGSNFSDEQLVEPFSPPTTLGGVSVRMDGAPQRIRSVSPTRVVFLVDPAGLADRTVELTTKAGVKHTARMRVATAWPSLFVQATGDDSEAYIPSGLWTLDGIQLRPITSAPVPVGSSSRPTLVILQGSGWRNALAIAGGVQVRLNGIPCPVIAARASALFAGQDELVFQIPAYLAGRGEMDVTVSVAGRNSNYARINLGAAAAFNAASGKASGKTTTSFKRQNR